MNCNVDLKVVDFFTEGNELILPPGFDLFRRGRPLSVSTRCREFARFGLVASLRPRLFVMGLSSAVLRTRGSL
jgi:hypothetical protein